jgi:cyanophycin synthetase
MQPMIPFEDSRRLTGSNLYFDDAGAALETLGAVPNEVQFDAWRARVGDACAQLGWPEPQCVMRRHVSGASLAFTAPIDQLYAATEVNEWAWSATVVASATDASAIELFYAPAHPAAWDDASALHTLRLFARDEQRPAIHAMAQAAAAHGVSFLLDDDALSIGTGVGSQTWPMGELPDPANVDWSQRFDIPSALVTGSNGKTTTVRLLAAMACAHGWLSAYSCTDGLFFDNEVLESGDYSGPGGARTVLRDRRVEAAILETARGGMLRRGIASQRANAAVVTNISDDHFGEYGIHTLDDLADVKLTVARVLHAEAPLVLNADDAVLVRKAKNLVKRIAWFALDHDDALLQAHRANGGWTCGVREGRLLLTIESTSHDLGDVTAMPLTFGAQAQYNIANIAAASLAASALGIAPQTIGEVLTRFGTRHSDNSGRLQHWRLADVEVFLDYAHNPEGLRGLLNVATHQRTNGRLGLLLGQAGNRGDVEIRELAAVAASYKPGLLVLKDLGDMLRGRDPGEVPALLRVALHERGVNDEAIIECLDEQEAALYVLRWARAGDVIVLPIHSARVRTAITDLLDRLQEVQWRAGQDFPLTVNEAALV